MRPGSESAPPRDVHDLLGQLIRRDSGRPRVTWYGPDAERVELSAKTLENWVAKTANFLLDEVDAQPGSTIGIDLPVHWRSVVWLLATWAVGAHAVIPAGGVPMMRLDALVTPHVAAPPSVVTGALIVVSLPALATRYRGELPTGAIDAATEIRLQPDAFPAVARPSPDAPALSVWNTRRTVTHGDLFATAGVTSWGQGALRVLSDAGPERALEAYLAPFLAGGSVVLHHDLSGLDGEARAHLAVQEGVTEQLG